MCTHVPLPDRVTLAAQGNVTRATEVLVKRLAAAAAAPAPASTATGTRLSTNTSRISTSSSCGTGPCFSPPPDRTTVLAAGRMLLAMAQAGPRTDVPVNRQPSEGAATPAESPFSLLLPDALLLAGSPKAAASLAAAVGKLLQRWELQLADRERGCIPGGGVGGQQDGVGSARESKDSRRSTSAPMARESFCSRSSYGGGGGGGSSSSSSSGTCAEAASAVAAAACRFLKPGAGIINDPALHCTALAGADAAREAPAVVEARRRLSCLRAFGTWKWLPALARVTQHMAEAGGGWGWSCCGDGAHHTGMQQVEGRGSTAGEQQEGAPRLGDECWQVVLAWVVVLCSRLRLQWRCWGVEDLDSSSGEEEEEGRTAAASEEEYGEADEGTASLCCWLGGCDGFGRSHTCGRMRCVKHGSSGGGGGGGGGAGRTSLCRCWREFLLREVGVVGLVGSALRELVPRLVGRAAQQQGPGAGERRQAADEVLRLVAGAAILVAREFWDEPEMQAALQPDGGSAAAVASSNANGGQGAGKLRPNTGSDGPTGSPGAAACAAAGSTADGTSRGARGLRSQVSTSDASCYDSCYDSCGTGEALTPGSSLLCSLNRSLSPSGSLPPQQPDVEPPETNTCSASGTNLEAGSRHSCPCPRPWPAEGLKALAQHFRAGRQGGVCAVTATWAEPGCSVLEKMCKHKHKQGGSGGDRSVRQRQRQQEQLLDFSAGGCAAWLGQVGEQVPRLCELRALLRPCSNPGCVSLPPGDATEAEAEQQQVVCGVCGVAWYCCRECRAAHWRAGHREECAAPSPAETPTAVEVLGMGSGACGGCLSTPLCQEQQKDGPEHVTEGMAAARPAALVTATAAAAVKPAADIDGELARAVRRLEAAAAAFRGAVASTEEVQGQELCSLAQTLDEGLARWQSRAAKNAQMQQQEQLDSRHGGAQPPATVAAAAEVLTSPLSHAPFRSALLALFPSLSPAQPAGHTRGVAEPGPSLPLPLGLARSDAACLLREAGVRWLLQHLADADDLEQTAAAYQAKQAVMDTLALLPSAPTTPHGEACGGGQEGRAAALLRWGGLAAEAACSGSMARARPQTVAKLAAVLGLGRELEALTHEGE